VGMANLSSLVHELRERIAATSSTPTHIGDDVALETRFRAVLPNLLHAYVVPSPSGTFSLPTFLLSLFGSQENE
jgi:serine/threonine-protein kinase ATR